MIKKLEEWSGEAKMVSPMDIGQKDQTAIFNKALRAELYSSHFDDAKGMAKAFMEDTKKALLKRFEKDGVSVPEESKWMIDNSIRQIMFDAIEFLRKESGE